MRAPNRGLQTYDPELAVKSALKALASLQPEKDADGKERCALITEDVTRLIGILGGYKNIFYNTKTEHFPSNVQKIKAVDDAIAQLMSGARVIDRDGNEWQKIDFLTILAVIDILTEYQSILSRMFSNRSLTLPDIEDIQHLIPSS